MNSHLLATLTADSSDGLDGALLVLRAVVGLTVSAHGLNKFLGGGRIPGTARWFTSMGMKPNGTVHAILAASTETGSGILFALGFLTPLAAAGIVALMLVAAWTVHRPNGFFIVKDGFEYNLVLATVAVCVAVAGPGRYSLDRSLDLDVDWFVPKQALAICIGGAALAVLLLVFAYRPNSVPAKTTDPAPAPAPAEAIHEGDVPVPGDHDADPGALAAEEVPEADGDHAEAAVAVPHDESGTDEAGSAG
jgi:putative oxidoreductase